MARAKVQKMPKDDKTGYFVDKKRKYEEGGGRHENDFGDLSIEAGEEDYVDDQEVEVDMWKTQAMFEEPLVLQGRPPLFTICGARFSLGVFVFFIWCLYFSMFNTRAFTTQFGVPSHE